MRGRVAWVAAVFVVVSGCATSGLREATERNRAQLLELGQDVDRLTQDMTALRGELRELRASLQVERDAAERRQAQGLGELGERVAGADQQLQGLADTLRGLETTVAGLEGEVARIEALSNQASGGLAAKERGPAPGPGSVPPSAEELFDRGMERFRAGELGQSVLELEEFVEKHPSHPLVASARFWIGEAYFRARDYAQAAVEYRRAVAIAPSGEKTPEALLKLGLVHRALRREDDAREAWAQLLRDFPESESAAKARAALRETPRSGRSTGSSDAK